MNLKRIFIRIKQVISNIPQIFEGIINYFIQQEDIEKISEERYSICKACPSIDFVGKECLAPGSQPCCSLCGCSLHFKTRSLSSECPAGKWKALMTEEEEEKLLKK